MYTYIGNVFLLNIPREENNENVWLCGYWITDLVWTRWFLERVKYYYVIVLPCNLLWYLENIKKIAFYRINQDFKNRTGPNRPIQFRTGQSIMSMVGLDSKNRKSQRATKKLLESDWPSQKRENRPICHLQFTQIMHQQKIN